MKLNRIRIKLRGSLAPFGHCVGSGIGKGLNKVNKVRLEICYQLSVE